MEQKARVSQYGSEPSHIHQVMVDPALEEIVPKFVKNLERQINELNEAVVTGDISTVQRIAHTLKGVCGGYGFDELGLIAKQIDERGKAHEMEGVPELIHSMLDYMDHMEIIYERDDV